MQPLKQQQQHPLLLLALLVLLGTLHLCTAYDYAGGARRKRWSPADLPNPQRDFRACGRAVRSSICDPEFILTPEQQNMVDGLINEIASGAAPFKTAECGGGGQQGYQVGTPGVRCGCMHMHARHLSCRCCWPCAGHPAVHACLLLPVAVDQEHSLHMRYHICMDNPWPASQ